MKSERWQQVEDLYHAASEKPTGERSAFLKNACAGDEDLCREVLSLLSRESSDALVDRPVAAVAASLMNADERLAAGTELGPYRIEEEIGAGGMGRVYRAHDIRLGRTVALKVSHTEFGQRFEREARVIATLNHPHICQIYDVGPNFLVMEYVEGRPLHGPLPLSRAVEYASQILDALSAAHRKAIVHRDLKPGNMLVTRQGIKLLDFGLAKQQPAVRSEAGGSSLTTSLTGAGVILGTLQYMAPEQLEGKPADVRSDIFSFGCVLYEMLTGKRAFLGESAASVMAAIMEREPQPLEISPPLDRVVVTCLAKDPDQRFQSAADLKRALEWAVQQSGESGRPRKPRWLWPAAAGAVAMFVLASGAWIFRNKPPAADGIAMRFQIAPPPGDRSAFTSTPGLSISPDGRYVTYHAVVDGRQGLWAHALDGSKDLLLSDLPETLLPFWSQDSKSIAFFSGPRLLRTGLSGESPAMVCTFRGQGRGGVWLADGRIIFSSASSNGLMVVSQSGGVPSQITALDKSLAEVQHMTPQLLPGGRLMYIAQAEQADKGGTYVISLDRPQQRVRVFAGGLSPRYSPGNDGKHYLLWRRNGTLIAQELNPASMTVKGQPVRLLDRAGASSAPNLTVDRAGQGLLVYHAGVSGSQLMLLDRTGRSLGSPGEPGRYTDPRISHDGQRLAISRSDDDGQVLAQIWVLEFGRGIFSRFTFDRYARAPLWSPDDRVLLFQGSAPSSLQRKELDGGSESEALPAPEGFGRTDDWSQDGGSLLYMAQASETQRDIWLQRLTADGRPDPRAKATPYLRTPFNEYAPRFAPGPSPRWVTYISDESGREEVYVASFPNPRRRLQITNGGGNFPQWGPGGRELFYVSADSRLMSVTLTSGTDGLEASAPRELFPVAYIGQGVKPYEAMPDGQRFVVLAPTQRSGSMEAVVNWPALLGKPSAQ